MLDALRKLLHQRTPTEGQTSGPDSVQLAACALLLELAHADGEFSPAERAYLTHALTRHFGLGEAELQALMEAADAERRDSIDHFQFTREITRGYDLGQKMVLAEVMWGLILADGELAENEAYLIRKIANLLDLEPAYLSQAKARAKGGG
jgi:uncharacterized tellurite resistance protein B-like protein